MAATDNKVEDAELVESTSTEEAKITKPADPTKELVVMVRDIATKEIVPNDNPITIPLTEEGRVSLIEAAKFVKEFTASKCDDDNALLVTAHLKNGDTWSELYHENTAYNFSPDLAIDSLKMTLTTKVWKFLNSIAAFTK